jgi:catechol 2,3-dioxygenase-like lactoylglutathione lyase family enzyme
VGPDRSVDVADFAHENEQHPCHDDVVTDDADQGGEAPCWAHFADDLDQRPAAPISLASNTILYCDRWSDVVDFYRTSLGLRSTMERDWFVEFELHSGAHLSVADSSRSTVAASDGSGLTLSWRVDDVRAARARLLANDVEVSPIETRWGADAFFVFDPAGHRIEFWSADD